MTAIMLECPHCHQFSGDDFYENKMIDIAGLVRTCVHCGKEFLIRTTLVKTSRQIMDEAASKLFEGVFKDNPEAQAVAKQTYREYSTAAALAAAVTEPYEDPRD